MHLDHYVLLAGNMMFTEFAALVLGYFWACGYHISDAGLM